MKKIKKVMAYAMKLTFHSNCYFVISSVSNFSLMVKLLLKDFISDYQLGKRSNKLEFINLYFCEIKSIFVEGLINLY